jgi:hypothetical protein
MKILLRIATVSFGMALLAGCASTKTAYRDAPTHEGATSVSIKVDERYVAHVENVARQRGTKVTWVNKPVKRSHGTVAVAD